MNNDEEKKIFRKHAFVEDKNNRGNVIISLSGFYPRDHKKYYDVFIKYIKELIDKAIEISKNHGKETIIAHLDLRECSMKNFSVSFFKKINKVLETDYQDVLKTFYMYSNSKFLEIVWKIIKGTIDPVTKEKIKFIKK